MTAVRLLAALPLLCPAATAAQGASDGACPVDLNDPVGAPYHDVERALTRIIAGGTICTGILLNNTAEDGVPYVLAPKHCGSLTNAAFAFDAAGACGGSLVLTGATLLASSTEVDASLYRLNAAFPAGSHPFLAGWNRSGTSGVPSAAVVPVAGSSTLALDDDGAVAAGSFWSAEWNLGTVLGGGGAPLLDDEKRVLGPGCCATGSCGSEIASFGRFDLFWTFGDLGQWLDPLESGALTVDGLDLSPFAPVEVPLGCGVNPAGSLIVDGLPAIGATTTFKIDNPLGTQPSGSIPFLGLALNPAPGVPPCGTLIPGLGMAGGGAPGELLLSVAAPDPIGIVGGGFWAPGMPAPINVSTPASCSLLGVSVYVQGVLFDFTPGAAVPVALTEGVRVSVGP
ncbi:MAG: hypothetical protein AAF682_15150 [Planctomycetota bacterium]